MQCHSAHYSSGLLVEIITKPWQCHYNTAICIYQGIFASHMQTALTDTNELRINN